MTNQFMKPNIVKGQWLLVETNCGTETLEVDLIGRFPWLTEGDVLDVADIPQKGLERIKLFIEGNRIFSVELATGYGARLSAPGYLDCTEWTFFEKLDKAEEHLRRLTEDDTEDTEDFFDEQSLFEELEDE